jgi:hypothetical protein
MNQRQKEQQRFDESNNNLVVGNVSNCPLPLYELARIQPDSPYVVEVFNSGLTAEVYHLKISGAEYTLKKKRTVALVQNPDGRYSFLNEVQRRHDLQTLKDNSATSEAYRHIVPTLYADYRQGIILSPWLEGELMQVPDKQSVSQLFSTLLACEQAGLFEWDLCAGNIIIDNSNHLWLFDFGYMYRFNPLRDFNSNGTSDPLFQFCERFETRFLSGWLAGNDSNREQALAVFRIVKEAALETLLAKVDWLTRNHADSQVITLSESLIKEYQAALESPQLLEQQFTLDLFRSHVLDIEDDISGKSCTPTTSKRVSSVIKMLDKDYELLKAGGALFYHNAGKKRSELLKYYVEIAELVEQYQV